jgi:hypothetical protein
LFIKILDPDFDPELDPDPHPHPDPHLEQIQDLDAMEILIKSMWIRNPGLKAEDFKYGISITG